LTGDSFADRFGTTGGADIVHCQKNFFATL
jgi:hypothetical protein